MSYPYSSYNEIYTVSRRLSIQNDSVLGTELLEEKRTGHCVWDGNFTIATNKDSDIYQNSDNETLQALFPDIYEEYTSYHEYYQEWKTKYNEWIESISDAQLSPLERTQSMTEAGLVSTASLTFSAIETSHSMYEKHADSLLAVVPTLEVWDRISIYNTFSPWEHIGDLDEDGAISASDATEILQASARNGAGEINSWSIESQQFADINADGRFNAADASMVLIFAANQGSGNKQTLEEFVNESCNATEYS